MLEARCGSRLEVPLEDEGHLGFEDGASREAPRMALIHLSGSTAAFCASTMASDMAAMLRATMTWFAELRDVAAAMSPTRVTLLPMTPRISFTCSKTPRAPHHDASLALDGLGSPPLTGAIQHLDALAPRLLGDFPARERSDGAQSTRINPRPGPLEHPALSSHRLLHLGEFGAS